MKILDLLAQCHDVESLYAALSLLGASPRFEAGRSHVWFISTNDRGWRLAVRNGQWVFAFPGGSTEGLTTRQHAYDSLSESMV